MSNLLLKLQQTEEIIFSRKNLLILMQNSKILLFIIKYMEIVEKGN